MARTFLSHSVIAGSKGIVEILLALAPALILKHGHKPAQKATCRNSLLARCNCFR